MPAATMLLVLMCGRQAAKPPGGVETPYCGAQGGLHGLVKSKPFKYVPRGGGAWHWDVNAKWPWSHVLFKTIQNHATVCSEYDTATCRGAREMTTLQSMHVFCNERD